MDGNRRWAKERGKSSLEGHQAGLDALKNILESYTVLREEFGIQHFIFYAFSTENWNRSEKEVRHLLDLFESSFEEIENAVASNEHPPRIRFVGNRSAFSNSLQEKMHAIEAKTHENIGTVALAVSYGGRDEIVRAVAKVCKKGGIVDEETISSSLDTVDIPDPDLIIRTSGEQRLSNFLLWQAAYAELFFLKKFWPDIVVEDLKGVVEEYTKRQKRYGT